MAYLVIAAVLLGSGLLVWGCCAAAGEADEAVERLWRASHGQEGDPGGKGDGG